MISIGELRTVERRAAVWVASVLLADPRCVAVRVLPPVSAAPTPGPAGCRDALYRLYVETEKGRRFTVTVVIDEPIPEGSLSQVPAWALPGLFADALANPDPRWWVALVTGRDSPFAVTLVRDYVLRRLVMARHLEAARNGVHVALADNEVILDLGLDIAPLVGAFAALSTVVDEVDGDAPRSTDRR